MRLLRNLSKEKNFRPRAIRPGMVTTMRTPIEPAPVGNIVLVPCRVTGYEVNAKTNTNLWKTEGRRLQSHEAPVVEQDALQTLFQNTKDDVCC